MGSRISSMQVIKVIIGWEMLSKRIKPRAYRLQKEYRLGDFPCYSDYKIVPLSICVQDKSIARFSFSNSNPMVRNCPR